MRITLVEAVIVFTDYRIMSIWMAKCLKYAGQCAAYLANVLLRLSVCWTASGKCVFFLS